MKMHTHKQKTRQQGLTLTELVISIAIIAVMMLLALPSFSSISKNGRIRTQINDFHLSLLQARNEAITRISRISSTYRIYRISSVSSILPPPHIFSNYTIQGINRKSNTLGNSEAK